MDHVMKCNPLYSRNQSNRQANQFGRRTVSEDCQTPFSYTLPPAEHYQDNSGVTETYTNLEFDAHMRFRQT